jgi:hypothetical protein
MRLPSLKQLVDRLRDTSDEGLVDGDRHVAFFSNLNVASEDELGVLLDHFFTYKSGHADAAEYCWFYDCAGHQCSSFTHSHTGVEYADVDAGLEVQREFIEQTEDQDTAPDGWQQNGLGLDALVVYCLSQAMAMSVISPDVYLFINKDEAWRDNSAWKQWEYWALTRNPNVQRIWRVDSRDPDDLGLDLDPYQCDAYGAPVILWDRNNGGEELPTKMFCPIKYGNEGEPYDSWGDTQ